MTSQAKSHMQEAYAQGLRSQSEADSPHPSLRARDWEDLKCFYRFPVCICTFGREDVCLLLRMNRRNMAEASEQGGNDSLQASPKGGHRGKQQGGCHCLENSPRASNLATPPHTSKARPIQLLPSLNKGGIRQGPQKGLQERSMGPCVAS